MMPMKMQFSHGTQQLSEYRRGTTYDNMHVVDLEIDGVIWTIRPAPHGEVGLDISMHSNTSLFGGAMAVRPRAANSIIVVPTP